MKPPPAVQLCLGWIAEKLSKPGGRLSLCRPISSTPVDMFRTDAKADGDDVVVAGWECRGGITPDKARWFSIRLDATNSPWIYCRGEPYRVVAALELYATLFGVLAFMPPGDQNDGSAIITGGASSDNKGNAYAAAKLMSTKSPLSAVVMELSEQLEARGSWLKLAWAPRQQNEEADALSNQQFEGFDMDKRMHLDPAAVEWIILPKMLELGGGMIKELEERRRRKREERRSAKEAKKRRKLAKDTLKVRDPWE